MARWQSCNVLLAAPNSRQLWQFNATKFNLQREEKKAPGEMLSEKLVAKDWQSFFQPKLNIAWFPADKAFVRVVQLPKADAAETQSMVELQLEKLSPLPVTQIVWSYEVFPYLKQDKIGEELNPHANGELQTVIVIMAERDRVEAHLGQIENAGFIADRLELPLLDELRATKVKDNGAWVFPNVGGQEATCLIAWWCDGVLQNLSLVHLPADEKRGPVLQEQIAQTIWAGEIEGWLTSDPKLRLVADEAATQAWLPLFDLTQQVEVVAPVPPKELAALTARRVAGGSTATNLLPPDFSARYKQQLIDRLWMRSLGALVALYVLGALFYLGGVKWTGYQHGSRVDEIASLGPTYTNTVQVREKLKVLQDTLELQYAALECYLAVAKTLPTELTLNNINFERGREVTFFGTYAPEDRTKVLEFNAALIEYTVKTQRFFAKVNPPNMQGQPGAATMNWNFACDLKRTDASE